MTNTVTLRARAANAGSLEQLVLPGSKLNFSAHVVIALTTSLRYYGGRTSGRGTACSIMRQSTHDAEGGNRRKSVMLVGGVWCCGDGAGAWADLFISPRRLCAPLVATQREGAHHCRARSLMQRHPEVLSTPEKFEEDATAPSFLLAPPSRKSMVWL